MNSKKKNALATLTATAMLITGFLPGILPMTVYAEEMKVDPNLTIGESQTLPTNSEPQVKMAVPDRITGIIDPFNVNGAGQIAFEEIVVENMGETPTQVFLKDFTFHSDTIECIETPITEETQGKKVHLWLVDEAGKTYALPPKGEPIDLGIVSPAEKLTLKLDGQANHYFYEWLDTDSISFSLSFSFKPDTTAMPIVNLPLIPLEPSEQPPGTVLDPIEPTEPILPPNNPEAPTEPILPPTDPEIPTDPIAPPAEPEIPTDPIVPPAEPETPTDPIVPPTEPETPTEPLTPPTEPEIPTEPPAEIATDIPEDPAAIAAADPTDEEPKSMSEATSDIENPS